MNNVKVKLLDCTLRDGGQCLEAAYRAEISKTTFNDEIIRNTIEHLSKSDVDIIELGYIENSNFDNHPFSNFFSIKDVSKFIPKQQKENQMYVALFTGPDVDECLIPKWNSSLVEGTRVILRYSELIKSIDYCEMLCNKGYKVFVQPMLTMRYTDKELEMLINRANAMKAYAVYIVDSFGYMQSEDLERLFKFYDERLDPDIHIGFHAHNNLNLAFSNVQHFLRLAKNRKIIIDSCALGMGQGAGNMQTELILPYLNTYYGKKYVYNEILDVCEQVETLTSIGQWGYSAAYVLPAVYNVAYKYSVIMREKMKFSYSKINYVLKNIPAELSHRYTDENLRKVLEELKVTK